MSSMEIKLKEAILSSEEVSYKNYHKIQKYMETMPEDFKAVYNISPTWLIDEYRLVDLGDIVLTMKAKRFLGNIICELNSTITKDKLPELLEACIVLGVNLRLTQEEVDVVKHLFPNTFFKNADSCKGDFIYSRSNNFSTEGRKNESLRRGLRYMEKAGIECATYSGEDLSRFSRDMWEDIRYKLYDVMESYVSYKKARQTKKGYTFHLKKYIEHIYKWCQNGYSDLFCLKLYVDQTGRAYAYSISEKVNDFNITLPDRKNVLHKLPNMHQSFLVLNYEDIKYWCERSNHTSEILFNFGNAGGNKDLYENKMRMHPKEILKIYKLTKESLCELDKDIKNAFFNKTCVSEEESDGDMERSSLWD